MAGNTGDPGELNAYHEHWRSDAANYADPSVDYTPGPERSFAAYVASHPLPHERRITEAEPVSKPGDAKAVTKQ